VIGLFRALFRLFRSTDPADHTSVRRRKRATAEMMETAAKVRGAALDTVDRSERANTAIDDLLRRMQ